jgi:NADH-quinone oxidoreductase subunit G
MKSINAAEFVVVMSPYKGKSLDYADVLLPIAPWTETSGTFINTEGRVQTTRQAIFPVGDAKEDWKILRALSDVLGKKLPYDSHADVRTAIAKEFPPFAAPEQVVPAAWSAFGVEGALSELPFALTIKNYYLTDAISRASPTMAKCAAEIWPLKKASGMTGGCGSGSCACKGTGTNG